MSFMNDGRARERVSSRAAAYFGIYERLLAMINSFIYRQRHSNARNCESTLIERRLYHHICQSMRRVLIVTRLTPSFVRSS